MSKNSIIILISSIFIICIQLFLIIFCIVKNSPIISIFLNFTLIILYCFITIYYILYIKKIYSDLNKYKAYNETLLTLYDNIKSFKHDFNNIIYTIGGFINTNDTKNLKIYYESISKDLNYLNNLSILNPEIINNSGIYNLLLAKYKKASSYNVTINLECFLDFNKINNISIYELSRVLGILIDNAIEAASLTNEKQVNILFRNSFKNNTQLIKIENTYKNKNIDKNKIFEKGVTEKQDHYGMGLWKVKQIIKKNKNIKLITNIDNKYFVQQIEIYY